MEINSETTELIASEDLYRDRHLPYLTSKSMRYQWLLIFFIGVIWTVGLFVACVVPFVFMNPVFLCNGV